MAGNIMLSASEIRIITISSKRTTMYSILTLLMEFQISETPPSS